MPSSRTARRLTAALVLSLGSLAATDALAAQDQKESVPPPRVEATRAELEALAAHPPKGMSDADRASVKSRLANGDFAVGDKVLIQVLGDTTYTDSFTVRSGRVLMLPALPPLSLAGVLRSESDSVITAYLERYLRNPEVIVTPLVRIGVLGGVAQPGYYDVPAQSLLSDVVMSAGGLTSLGDMRKSKVFRGNEEVLDPKATNVAVANGSTLDLLNLQSGDNFNVGVTNPQASLNKVQIITALLAIPLMIVSIAAIGN